MNFQSFGANMAAVTLTFRTSQKLKTPVWQMFPSTHLPSFIQISSAVSEKQVRDARTNARTHERTHARTAVHELK
jgi:hypothetical protein